MNTYICEYLNQIPKFYEKYQTNRNIYEDYETEALCHFFARYRCFGRL